MLRMKKVCLKNVKKFAVGTAIFFLAVVLGGCGQKREEETSESNLETRAEVEELTIWYTDPKIAPYINQAAEAYREQTGISILVEEQSSIDYLESINQTNISGEQGGVDLYVLNSDSLE